MKNLPSLLLTLIISVAFSTLFSEKTQALHLDENGVKWWSVEELLDYSAQVDVEEQAICGGDTNCREELFFNKFENEPKYRALSIFREGRFLVTSINPEEEKLEVFYSDEDPMLKRWGIEEKQPLEHIFLAWFNEPNNQIGNYNYDFPAESQFTNDLHVLYVSNPTISSYPANVPFELPISSTNLKNNQLGRIYLAVFGWQFNAKGSTDYSSCTNDSMYEPGETCKLAFSADHGSTYLPSIKFATQNATPEGPVGNDTALGATQDDPIIETNDESTPTNPESDTTTRPQALQPQATQSQNIQPQTSIKTPNTGSLISPCEKVVEFPWWLGILIIIGNVVVLWFFWPKKSKKLLTKKTRCDKLRTV